VNPTFPIGIGDPTVPIGSRIFAAEIAIAACTLSANVLAALFAERRKAEERLLEALTAGGVMAFECDLGSGLARHSGNAAHILGLGQPLTVAEFLGRIHPDDRARIEAHQARLRVDSPADTVTFRLIRPDGWEVWLEKRASTHAPAAGERLRDRGAGWRVSRGGPPNRQWQFFPPRADLVPTRQSSNRPSKQHIETIGSVRGVEPPISGSVGW
jgi:PAS fold